MNIHKQVSITTAEVRNEFILKICATLHIKGTEKAFFTYKKILYRNDSANNEKKNIIRLKRLIHSAGLVC